MSAVIEDSPSNASSPKNRVKTVGLLAGRFSASEKRGRTFLAMLAIVAAAALLTLHRLGAADVCGVNEAVEGVFLQQMVEHGALLFPVENGRSPMYKPPLFHWTAAAVDKLAGMRKVTSFNLRLPA